MSVYVDDAFRPWRETTWCHLTADTLGELHEFAERIGLRRSWFQDHRRPEFAHYDVSPRMRAAACAAGAVEETQRDGAARRMSAVRRRDDVFR